MTDRKRWDNLELDWKDRAPRGKDAPAEAPAPGSGSASGSGFAAGVAPALSSAPSGGGAPGDPDRMPEDLRYALDALFTSSGLRIHQVKEWTEAILGWETGNKYAVDGPDGRPLLYVNEQGGGLLASLARNLWAFRTIRLDFATLGGVTVMHLERPWRLFFARAEISAWDGRPMGSIQQRFAIFRRRLDVLSPAGNVLAEVVGPAFKPWTFEVHRGGVKLATIRKKWSGFGAEMFTDADNFGIEFHAEVDGRLRQLLVATTLMVDLLYFEVKQGGRGGVLGMLTD